MFYSLTGVLIHKEPGMVALNVGGVGYKCMVTLNTLGQLPELGAEATLFTYLHVKEGIFDLYGFHTIAEENCFKMLLTVSGVGPKAALGILSDLTPERLALAIVGEDVKTIKAAPGIGPKTAQRIVLELKDKMKSEDVSAGFSEGKSGVSGGRVPMIAGSMGEAISALVVLGYSQSDAVSALVGAHEDLPVEELIKIALKKLALQ